MPLAARRNRPTSRHMMDGEMNLLDNDDQSRSEFMQQPVYNSQVAACYNTQGVYTSRMPGEHELLGGITLNGQTPPPNNLNPIGETNQSIFDNMPNLIADPIHDPNLDLMERALRGSSANDDLNRFWCEVYLFFNFNSFLIKLKAEHSFYSNVLKTLL